MKRNLTQMFFGSVSCWKFFYVHLSEIKHFDNTNVNVFSCLLEVLIAFVNILGKNGFVAFFRKKLFCVEFHFEILSFFSKSFQDFHLLLLAR